MNSDYITISKDALARIPHGRILGECVEEDMSGVKHEAVKVLFLDETNRQARTSYFDKHTGEYLSEGW